MTAIKNFPEKDWDDGLWENNVDSLYNYVLPELDFKDQDLKGFVIQIPKYKDFEFESFRSFRDGTGITDIYQDTTLTEDEQIEKINNMFTIGGKKVDAYKYYKIMSDSKTSPVVKANKNAGKFLAVSYSKDGQTVTKSKPTSNENTALKYLEDRKKINDKVQKDIIVNGVKSKKTFDNEEEYEKFIVQQSRQETRQIFENREIGDLFDKYYSKNNVFKGDAFDVKLYGQSGDGGLQATWMKYVSEARSYSGGDRDIYINELTNTDALEKIKDRYTNHKMIEIYESPSKLIELFNQTFKTLNNQKPYKGKDTTFHLSPVTDIELDVLEEVYNFIMSTNAKGKKEFKDILPVVEMFLKQNKRTDIKTGAQIIKQVQNDINKGSVSQSVGDGVDWTMNAINEVLSGGLFNSELADARRFNDKNYQGRLETVSKKENGDSKYLEVGNVGVSPITYSMKNHPYMVSEFFENDLTFTSIRGISTARDMIENIYYDLKKIYLKERGTVNQKVNPMDFVEWLYQHEDPMFSETDDNEIWSYWEVFKKSSDMFKQGTFDVTNDEIIKVLRTDLGDLKGHQTFRLSFDEYNSFSNNAMHPSGKPLRKIGYRDRHKTMIHQNPAILLNYLQSSHRHRLKHGVRGGTKVDSRLDGYSFWTTYQENAVIDELNRAFGTHDENGDWKDAEWWFNLSPNEFPTVEDILEEYYDEGFANTGTSKKKWVDPNKKIKAPQIRGTVTIKDSRGTNTYDWDE